MSGVAGRGWAEVLSAVPPETRYATTADGIHLAYQVVGDGPGDVVVMSGFISHLEHQWANPGYARSMERLASFSRVIAFDKRGLGLSDPVPMRDVSDLEKRIEDIAAVMAAAASERAALFAVAESGAVAALFAATYPERVSALILYGSWARFFWAEDYPAGVPRSFIEPISEAIGSGWGSAPVLDAVAPSAVGDSKLRAWWAEWERLSASPGTAQAYARVAMELDVRPVLGHLRVPTLVLRRRDDPFVPVTQARYLADHIPGSRLVELPGRDHPHFLGDVDSVMDEIEEFLTGARAHADDDRALVTVLFTDIVGSTALAAEIGDRQWAGLLEAHYGVVRRQLERFGGAELDIAGDGFLARFDIPARAIRCALAIREGVHRVGVTIRAGVHTGEVVAKAGKVTGVTVHIGARVAALADPDEVLVTQTVRDLLVGSSVHFADRGLHALKGVPNEWRLYAVE